MTYTVVPSGGQGGAILNLGGTPAVRATAGQGGLTGVFTLSGYATVPINMPTTNLLPLVRGPSNPIIKSVKIALDAAPSTSLTGSLGLVFSNANDGTSAIYQSTYATSNAVASIISQSCFLYQTAISTYYGGLTDVTFANAAGNSVTDGFYVPSASLQPIWQALSAGGAAGLGKATSGTGASAFTSCATDPGGFFDVTWFETTTGVNTGTCTLLCVVDVLIAAS